ncbi:MAG: dihydroorotate dehydrogenase [Candidatus Krumholzibacteriota bacterium]|nr:dihydroorotate dehydrogenase [Candidatus Krumholzibacteriota bacterium]
MTTRLIGLRIGPASFENPVMLASGPAGYGEEYAGLVDIAAVGAVVTKTVSLHPRPGNPGPRLQETPAGLLNSVGLENVGAEVFFDRKLSALLAAGGRAVVSLAGEDWEEYLPLLDRTAAATGFDAVELNLSCPNVSRGGMAVGVDPALVERYVAAARERLPGRAVFAKLTPNAGDLAPLARAAEAGGAHAVTAINTVLGLDVDTARRRFVFDRVTAGLSGPAILPVALCAVWQAARAVSIPVIGAGGIASVDDALKFFMAGAAAVQVGTGIFADPDLPARIVGALRANGVPAAIDG